MKRVIIPPKRWWELLTWKHHLLIFLLLSIIGMVFYASMTQEQGIIKTKTVVPQEKAIAPSSSAFFHGTGNATQSFPDALSNVLFLAPTIFIIITILGLLIGFLGNGRHL